MKRNDARKSEGGKVVTNSVSIPPAIEKGTLKKVVGQDKPAGEHNWTQPKGKKEVNNEHKYVPKKISGTSVIDKFGK